MTIWARNPDTGEAKWVYQMTPHDEWDYDGVNEMILTDQKIDGKDRKLLTHFDRNGFGYTLDRDTGELLVANKYDPKVNWATGIDMDKSSPDYGKPDPREGNVHRGQWRGRQLQGHLSGGVGHQGRAACGLFAGDRALLRADQPCLHGLRAVQGQLHRRSGLMSARRSPCIRLRVDSNMGNFIAWDGKTGKIVWSDPEQFSVWSGALATAGGVVFYGTLEGYLKAVDAKTGKELYKFKTPSGIIGNVMTYEHGGRQYVAILSGVGGWAGIGLAAGLTKPTEGLGAVGGYAALSNYTALGGTLTVFALPTD